jgi:coproporphyrinogen III oxidase-like Fe-S oxidoreductase
VRTQQWREPRRYLASDPHLLTRTQITARDLPFEFAMNGFRLVEGFSEALFEQRTGQPMAILQRALAPVTARELVENRDAIWRATPKGLRFLNEILVELLPGTEGAKAS